ncbi:MAG: hypothetical protein ACLTYW_08720 [Collinsella sp.]
MTFKIVLPQAIRFIIPSLISQLVVVVETPPSPTW